MIKHITNDFPPSFIMTSNCDHLRSESPKLEKILQDNGVHCVFKEYGDERTQLYHVFHCNVKTPEAAQANKDECDFFKELNK